MLVTPKELDAAIKGREAEHGLVRQIMDENSSALEGLKINLRDNTSSKLVININLHGPVAASVMPCLKVTAANGSVELKLHDAPPAPFRTTLDLTYSVATRKARHPMGMGAYPEFYKLPCFKEFASSTSPVGLRACLWCMIGWLLKHKEDTAAA